MYKLIIIDDEKRILEGIANIFPWDSIGFSVEGVFTNGRQALTYLITHSVNVVMTDIKMPEMDGIELIKELEKYSNIKIVLFSSFQNYEYFRSAIKYRVTDYLLKPIKYEELVHCFTEIKRELDNEKNVASIPVEQPQSYYDKVVAMVKEYIETNYRDASLEKAAALVSLSSSYLSKIFKEYAEIGFSDYLMKIRMAKACEFLEDIHYKSYEIANRVGYDNPKNFSRAFRSFYNVSPTEYRNKKTKDESDNDDK